MNNPEYIIFNPINSSLNYYPIHKVVKAKLNYLNEIEYVYEYEPIKTYSKINNIKHIREYNDIVKKFIKKDKKCFKI